ncbi:PQQ-binding-like beta-propeller repeat protein [Nocardioides sp. SYSU D00038]|uniref:outer membrane protein assembly factor BamB family protein n=1 Tax=Nocardioides sp. SYSU D00038 TaxID=2812554 RepID=UPI0019675871|nr:PQQ-binding-like beta-propeller repeat protein [Nocardioides sp. SYSU D00038]
MRAAIVVGTAGAAVTGLLWWGSADLTAGDPDHRAARFVPRDGTHAVVVTDDGQVTSEEHARLNGLESLLSTPTVVSVAVSEAVGEASASMRIWRQTTTWYDHEAAGGPEQGTSILAVDDRGVLGLASYGSFTLTYDPPFVELPADVHPGSEWSGEGTAGSGIDYRYELAAGDSDAGDDCLNVTGELALSRDGEEFFTNDVDEDWCEGRGIVSAEAGEVPGLDLDTEPLRPEPTVAEAADWSTGRLPLRIAERVGAPFATDSLFATEGPPVPGPDGGLVLASSTTRDLAAFVRRDDALVRQAVGHPGGEPTALGAAGDVAVVGTTTKRAVAYGSLGERLWTVELPDVLLTAPFGADDEHLVLATASGDVVVVDPATGEERWDDTVADQVTARPAYDDGLLVVVDVAGTVKAWDLAAGEVRWESEVPGAVAVAVVGDRVVVHGLGTVQALDAGSGDRLWSTAVDGAAPQGLGAIGDTVVVDTGEDTLALAVGDGAERWRRPSADQTLVLGELVVQARGHRVVALDADAEQVGSWPIDDDLSAPVSLVATETGVWATDVSSRVVEVGP